MSFSALLLTLAGLASLASWVWLVTVAFKNGERNWGVALIVTAFIPLVGPCVALAFIIKFWGIARRPALVFIGSMVLSGIGFLSLMNDVRSLAQDLGESPDFQAAVQQAHAMPNVTAETAPAEVASVPALAEPVRSSPPEPRPTEPSIPHQRPSRRDDDRAALNPPSPPSTQPVPPVPPEPDTGISPLVIDTLRVGDANPNQMRSVSARGRNTRDLAIREARLALSYYDARGLRLGRWITVHSESTNIVPAKATNVFTLQAFFVPQFTKDVRIEVEGIRFANGERWPPIDPALIRPVATSP